MAAGAPRAILITAGMETDVWVLSSPHFFFLFFQTNLFIIILTFSPANRPPCHEFAASLKTETRSGSAGEKTRLPLGGSGDSEGDSDWVIPWDETRNTRNIKYKYNFLKLP